MGNASYSFVSERNEKNNYIACGKFQICIENQKEKTNPFSRFEICPPQNLQKWNSTAFDRLKSIKRVLKCI